MFPLHEETLRKPGAANQGASCMGLCSGNSVTSTDNHQAGVADNLFPSVPHNPWALLLVLDVSGPIHCMLSMPMTKGGGAADPAFPS